MRTISKGCEPASLALHRRSDNADYANYAQKDDLRAALVTEQRGLCCYCLARINPAAGGMKIEHWRCQAHHAGEQLDYSNLLGPCLGNEGKPQKSQHCDTKKANGKLSRNPANPRPRVEDLVRFLPDGRIESDDTAFNDELDEILNLNEAFLINNRKATLEGFKQGLSKNGRWTRTQLEKWLSEWNGDSDRGDLRPFCQVVVYWLRKRLARA